MAKNRSNKGRPLVDLHMSVMNRDFAADADRVAAVSSATRLDSLRYRRVNARCMPAPIARADKCVTVEVVSGRLIRRGRALGLNRLSRGREHREWDRWQDQPAGEALWRHPATRDRVRQDAGHLTDLPETSRPQPCCPLSLWRWSIRTQRPHARLSFGTPQLSGLLGLWLRGYLTS